MRPAKHNLLSVSRIHINSKIHQKNVCHYHYLFGIVQRTYQNNSRCPVPNKIVCYIAIEYYVARARKGQEAWNAACSFKRTEGVDQPEAEGRPLRTGKACPYGRIEAKGLADFHRASVFNLPYLL